MLAGMKRLPRMLVKKKQVLPIINYDSSPFSFIFLLFSIPRIIVDPGLSNEVPCIENNRLKSGVKRMPRFILNDLPKLLKN